jgi:hypothetical protein
VGGDDFLSAQSTYSSGNTFKSSWAGTVPALTPAIKLKDTKLIYVLYREDNQEVLQVGEVKVP